MSLAFVKYEGAGNDFILIDNRGGIWQDFVASSKASEGSEKSLIARLCHPKFGIGADGLMKPAQILRAEFETLLAGHAADSVVHHCGSGISAVASAYLNDLV